MCILRQQNASYLTHIGFALFWPSFLSAFPSKIFRSFCVMKLKVAQETNSCVFIAFAQMLTLKLVSVWVTILNKEETKKSVKKPKKGVIPVFASRRNANLSVSPAVQSQYFIKYAIHYFINNIFMSDDL